MWAGSPINPGEPPRRDGPDRRLWCRAHADRIEHVTTRVARSLEPVGRLLVPDASRGLISVGSPVTLPTWVLDGYEAFLGQVADVQGFPCYLGTRAAANGALRYTFVARSELDGVSLASTLEEYWQVAPEIGSRSALVALVEPCDGTRSLADHEAEFWQLLQGLHDADPEPWPDHLPTDPDDPAWEFCFAGLPMFVTGHCPAYRQRLSRHSHSAMYLVMQSRQNLSGLDGSGRTATRVHARIRDLVQRYDAMAPSPQLGMYGDPEVRQWKQYWLPDTNEPTAEARCPLRISRPAVSKAYPLNGQAWATMPVTVTDSELTVGGWQVMQVWETPLMQAMASEAAGRAGSVLEVGFGMGIAADALIASGCDEYTVIEAHPVIAERARRWASQQDIPSTVIEGLWQDVVPTLAEHSFDGVLFDTYPFDHAERGRNHFPFIPLAPRLLRPGGVLVCYSDETAAFRSEHLELLLQNFREVKLIRVDGLCPPDDCEYWQHSQMVFAAARHT